MLRFNLVVILTLAVVSVTHAQNVQVQQPVVQQFSIDTTVVVPDRGSAFLGGVSKAATSVPTYGPMPYGTAFGSAVSSSYAETSVYIHDFELIDRLVLLEGQRRFAEHRSSPDSTALSTDPRVQYILKNRSVSSRIAKKRVTRNRLESKSFDRQKALFILKNRR